ncbi:ABC transporter permease/M1 family aminopeptidase [Aureivirga sp. CE67]|uniref:ABC transporter permease/M1 family aminopeptidase n=1 Tax=Aureivirga sp. CE67 TaxID=1788983 RepID=UPI0018CAA33C|nr:M1 family aminopeptidase [Aureivirga sp. CE67]
MWFEIFKFELKYRAKRWETYLFFLFLFFFSIVAVDFVFEGVSMGKIKTNAPIVIAKTMGASSGIFLFIASLIMGIPVLRDFQYNITPLMFINPIKKRDYLFGRFLGSFTVLIFVFSGIIWGNMFGELLPWRKPENQLPFDFWLYVYSFFTIVFPILFFGAALFFVVGTLTKKLLVVYTQGLFVFVLFLIVQSISDETISAFLDPFSLSTLTKMTENWSVVEMSSKWIPFDGILFWSKLFWISISALILFFGYKKFQFSIPKSKQKNVIIEKEKSFNKIKKQTFKVHKGFYATWKQFTYCTKFYFLSITKEVSFWAILIAACGIIFVNSINLGTVYNVDSYPASYFIVEELLEMSSYFFIMILVFYSGELIWKEKNVNIHSITDALPNSNFLQLSAKFFGLILIYVVLIFALIISGILFQISKGYYHFELETYFYGLFGNLFSTLIFFTAVSFFIHSIVNNKFVGYVLVLSSIIVSIVVSQLGFDYALYSFGGISFGKYSQMNGVGHLLKPFIWTKIYWILFCVLLFIFSALIIVRGTETKFKVRIRQFRNRFTKPIQKFTLIVFILFISVGGFIFYNVSVLNTYWTKAESDNFRVNYEKNLKQYEYIEQPKIIAVNLEVDLFPEERDYFIKGKYVLKNKSEKPISTIHVQKTLDSQIFLEDISFSEEVNLDEKYLEFDYYIFELKETLEPNDSLEMNFVQTFKTEGFESSDSNFRIVENGIFLRNQDLPSLGYNKKYELRDDDKREEFGLKARKEIAGQKNVEELKNAINGDDGYKIDLEIIVGTNEKQKAIAPGKLKNQWKKDGRNYFQYKSEKPMVNFYTIVSAEYETLEDVWFSEKEKEVALEIYYHKNHTYNLDRMMESMKMSLDYFSKNFSEYPYEELRIMEIPRYADFAQSFPTSIPFSESLGFVLDIDAEKDVDMAFYITAHEIAHQWWGLQVAAANVKGKHMILETLAQYSALMVLKQKYADEKVNQFLENEFERYKKGKLKEEGEEFALKDVEYQEYIYYRKGALAMFIIQKEIGEENVNKALQSFIQEWNILDATFDKNRYATTEDLLEEFRKVTPKEKQIILSELFEEVNDEILEKNISKPISE